MTRLIKLIAAILVFLYLGLQLLSFNFQKKGNLRTPERIVVAITAPGQKLTTGITSGLSAIGHHYLLLSGVARENETLAAERDRLKSQLVHLGEMESENGRLRELLGLGKPKSLQITGAELIARGMSPYERTIRVGKGSREGISPGMAVIHPKGVVGQVIEALPDRSDILLITDQASAIDVIDQRSRVRGILRGNKYDELKFEFVPKNEDLKVGDEIVSSGLDGVYPEGIPVGTITAVGKGSGQLFLSAAVRPHVDVMGLEEVAIVTGRGKGESP
ncbi:MAG: rod shape-determining protein MreC [Pseudomonadota bacterium]